jgi:alpha-tubulin suppressor-like RCC1 family protein
MKNGKILLQLLPSIVVVFSLILPASAVGASAAVPRPDDRSISHLVVDSSTAASAMALNTPEGEVTPMVTAGGRHIVGLKSDGTVVAVGNNEDGQCNVCGWTNITQVTACSGHTVALKAGGTVVAVGDNDYGQCEVGNWTDIIQVAAGSYHTVGLKADGTVVTVGDNEDGQCEVGSWTDIVQVTTGYYHTVGLKSDGTVLAVGYPENAYYGQCEVGNWTDIVQVAAGGCVTVGLRIDGTVVAVGDNYGGPCNVGNWTDIVQVAAGSYHTVGLKADGTLVAVGDNDYGRRDVDGWTDIIQVAASWGHTVGLKPDGTVVAVGWNYYRQCDVGGWTNITQVDAGAYHTVGLKDTGTVVALGRNNLGQCEVGNWTDIIEVTAGGEHTVGVKGNGTVVAVGPTGSQNNLGQCEVGDWTDIVQVAAGHWHTVGLKSDGTVVAAGDQGHYEYWAYGQCEVGDWMDVVKVAAGYWHTVGLKSDGTMVAVGLNNHGQCDVGSWTDVVQVAAGYKHTVGLKSDGTVVAVGDNYGGQCDVGDWTDIIQVAAGSYHTVGLKSDGTVVAVGYGCIGSPYNYGQCEVGSWTDILQVAAGYYHTVGLKSDGTVVAAGIETTLAKWDLVLAVPPSQCVPTLTISITTGGSVTIPGEGAFDYDEGTVVNLVAEPDEYYEFVEWTGDVDTIADVNAAQTTITMDGYYAITANFELEEGMCSLTISSTEGGSVTTPGEGTFIYDEGTVVDLVAEADEGYRFVDWTGDVNTIDDVEDAETAVTIDVDYYILANFEYEPQEGQLGVKAGDWIKVEYEISGWPADQLYAEWFKLEFLSVEGTSTTVLVTMHISDGTEVSDTVPVDVAGGGGEAFGLSGFVIPPDLTTGDYVHMTGYGYVAIEGETTRTYAGESRTVVYASISQSIPYQDAVELTYYWDKLTGVMVEASTIYADIMMTAKATETNMWGATTGACFIATAAYGTPMAEEIESLREFRDEYLLTNAPGQALVSLYYRVSPPIAEFIAQHPGLKPIVRTGLAPAVALSAIAVNTTPAGKTVMVGLLVLVCVALAIWAARRRRRGTEYV